MMMRAKTTNALLIALISFLLLLGVFCFGVTSSVAYAEEDSGQDTEITATVDEAEAAAESVNNAVKEWINIIFAAVNTSISSGIIVNLAAKKKQSVSVTVNDANTQHKLDSVSKEIKDLKEIFKGMLTIEKGTQEVFKALYADNPNIDNKVQNIINSVYMNSESVIKDITDIFSDETKTKIKTALDNVSNIILG